MRPRIITTITTRARLNPRHLVVGLAIAACSLAIPASASAQSPDRVLGYSGPTEIVQSSSPSVSSPSPDRVVSYGGSPGGGAIAPLTPTTATDGFSWGDAALGAGAALALLAFGGAVMLTARRRTPASPSASAS